MLIEKSLEERVASAITALAIPDSFVTRSRGSASVGSVMGEVDQTKGTIISVQTQLRANDDFSLPTVNIQMSVTVTTRGEMNATGDAHDATMESLVGLVDGWHYDADAMSTALSSEDFFAAGIRADGGSDKTYSEQADAWVETISFTIRGTVVRT